MTGLLINAEDAVTGILYAGLVDADHPDQGLGRGRLGDRPLERTGVGHIVRDQLVACATVAGDLNFHVACDALGTLLDVLTRITGTS